MSKITKAIVDLSKLDDLDRAFLEEIILEIEPQAKIHARGDVLLQAETAMTARLSGAEIVMYARR